MKTARNDGMRVLIDSRNKQAAPSRVVSGDMLGVSMPRKGFYERQPGFYNSPSDVEGGYVGFSIAMRCDSVVFLRELYSPEKVRRALAAGLRVWFYGGPGDWRPSNYRATRDEIMRYVASDSRIEGYIANVEEMVAPRGVDPLNDWGSAPRSTVEDMALMLKGDSASHSVGFASYPSFPHFRTIARMAPDVWGSPELYGIINPGTAQQLKARGVPWRASFAGYCPSLAAWGRDAAALTSYLNAMSEFPNVLFWHAEGATVPTGRVFSLLRDFVPGRAGQSTWRNLLLSLGISIVSGIVATVIVTKSTS